MKGRRKILFTISVLLSFLLIYISIRVVLSINTIKVNQVFYGQNLDKFLILGYTQLSCVVAVLFDIWTVFLTCMNKNILLNVNNRKSGMFYVENIFLVLNFISSIVIYLLISQVNLSKVPWLILAFVSMFNMMSVGFFLYNLIGCICLSKRKNISNYSDYEAFTENEISEITAKGIALKNGMYIDFAKCAEVWAESNSVEKSKCVGERDITDLSFMFYTLPKPIMIRFMKKSRLEEFFSKNDTRQRFYSLQNKIFQYGYRTFDIS